MGYVRNHVIVVTATYDNHIERAHAKASKIFDWVSPICPELINGSRSFFVPPDGSKEGWPESVEGDRQRDQFKAWLRAQAHQDGSSPLDWIEAWYGGDDHDSKVCDHADSKAAVVSETK